MANIFIYGSCVSRDSFEFLKESHNLSGYIARQSLISAMSRSTSLLGRAVLRSDFQSRMVNGDFQSNLLPKLRLAGPKIDHLVMDLTDERLGVHKLPDGAFVTRSVEFVASKRLEDISAIPRLIPLYSEQYWVLWQDAATRFAGELTSLGLKSRTLLLNTPWATETSAGDAAPLFRGRDTATFNRVLFRMAEFLRAYGVRVIDLPSELAVTTNSHKWGVAPFHYAPTSTKWLAEQISEALSV